PARGTHHRRVAGAGLPLPGGAAVRRAWVVCRHALGQLLGGRRLLVTALLSAIPLLAPALLFAARGDTDPVDFSLTLFCALGLTLSLFISRALAVGLVYVVLWEGALVSVAPSASSLAVRGYAEGVLAAITAHDGPVVSTRLGPLSSTVLASVVTLLALALATRRLTHMDIK